MKLSHLAAVLLVLFMVACGGPDMAATGVGEDCKFGISGNGNCLSEGDTGIPAAH